MLLLTWRVIEELIRQSATMREELAELYRQLPATRCQRKTYCCSMLPEMTLIEALAILKQMAAMNSDRRLVLLKKISSYFFLNAARISTCPFLDGQNCQVYEERFFGCRAYGLWSPAHYQKITTGNQAAKKHLRKQWQALDVTLPRAVVDFQVPYCPDVQTVERTDLDDDVLVGIADAVESLSLHFSEAHQSFRQSYYADFSFLVAAMLWSHRRAVQLKFDVVKEFLHTGQRKKLNLILDQCIDPFRESLDSLDNREAQ